MAEDYPRTIMEFERQFRDEGTCREYVAKMRWPEGFACPRCGQHAAWSTSRGLWMCQACRHTASVMAGTVFQDSHLPLTLWFRAMWHVTNQKHGLSALGLQRALGLGSYRTAWLVLHKLRHAMVRPGRDRLGGTVEVDETYWGAEEKGVIGRKTHKKARIVVAVETPGGRLGRVRMRQVPDLSKARLHGFIHESVTPGSVVVTDGLPTYVGLTGYRHDRQNRHGAPATDEPVLPAVHQVVSLLKRWMMGTHHGALSHQHLEAYLQEFTFRFNRRTSASRGKLFYRLVQQAVQLQPVTLKGIRSTQPFGVS
jgi:transposase-like protein/ribosomal protein L37AE/L43A